jgi:DNA-binding CsgD family transcriptional regulator
MVGPLLDGYDDDGLTPSRRATAQGQAKLHPAGVSYPDAPGSTRRLLFVRGRGARFDERERFLMTLLMPHIGPLLARTVTPRSRPDVALTDRQREVLRLVRLGMANKEVAQALKISTGTVRKHLENAYERLGVQSRTAALRQAALDDQARQNRHVA